MIRSVLRSALVLATAGALTHPASRRRTEAGQVPREIYVGLQIGMRLVFPRAEGAHGGAVKAKAGELFLSGLH